MADDFDVEAMLEAPFRKGKMCDRGGIELLQSKNENGMRSSPLMQMDMTTKTRRKGGAGARAEAPALGGEGAGAKTKRRVRRGARAEKENVPAAESVIAATPEARSVLGGTEHARAQSGNVPKVGAPSKKRRVPSETLRMLSGRITKSGSNQLTI